MQKISIIIPTFNSDKYLAKCLESLIFQEDPNLEIIIIDGGSSDGTKAIVKKFSSYISYFRSKKDNGQGEAVEFGIKIATGDILHWHSSDDIFYPNSLKNVRKAFDEDMNLKLLFSNSFAFDNFKVYRTGISKWVNYRISLFFFGRFQSDCAYWHSSLTDNYIPFDHSQPLSIDEDFFLKIWQNKKSRWISEELGMFRIHQAQLSQNISKSNLKKDRLKTRKYIRQRDKIRLYRYYFFKIFLCPEWLLRQYIFIFINRLIVYLFRVITRDKKRKMFAHNFFKFLNAKNFPESKVYFKRLENFTGLK